MKKSLLFSAALMAGASAFAVVPTQSKAEISAFSSPQPFKTVKAEAQKNTRAEGDVQTMDFTYAGNPSQAFNLEGATGGVTRVYLGFEMTADDVKLFKGSKVTGFNVLSPLTNNTPNTITDARFFYMLTMGKAEYSQDFKMSTVPGTENRIAMGEPYTITGEEDGIVFGYSFIVPAEDNMAYLITDFNPTDGTAGLYASSNTSAFPSKFTTFANQIGALCMSVTLEMESLPMAVSFQSFPADIYLPQGKELSYPIFMNYTATAPVGSITLEYTLGGKLTTQTLEADPPLPEGIRRSIKAYIDFPAQTSMLNEKVEFKISKVNDKDNDAVVSTAQSDVATLSRVPVRQTLMEEYTCTKCPYCTRGFAALEYIANNYPEFIAVSYHNSMQGADPMHVVTNFPSAVSGNPSSFLNRVEEMDPFYGSQYFPNYSVPIVGDILELNNIPTPWEIKVSHEWESDDVLVAKADIANMLGYKDGTYSIAYVLVADSLSGKTVSWRQSNAYATAPQEASYPEELNAFCRGGVYGKATIAGLVFNDVVISPNGILGVPGSVPSSLAAEDVVSHSLSFDLTKISKSLTIDKNKLRVVAAVLDKNGKVLNCAKNEVNDYDEFVAAVEGIEDENAPVEYYNLNGMKISEPTQGIVIRRQGSKAEKIIIR